MEAKRWTKFTIGSTYAVLAAFGLCTAVIDPLFHYHHPLSFLSYPLHNQRYQNDGILRHFDYDAIIIGTSMTENFKTSEFDRLWNVSSIKVPFNGGHYKEMDRAVRQGLKNNPNIKYVLRCLDYYFLDDKNTIRTDVEYPEYLYNDNLFDDVRYLLNKEIFLDFTKPVIGCTLDGSLRTVLILILIGMPCIPLEKKQFFPATVTAIFFFRWKMQPRKIGNG